MSSLTATTRPPRDQRKLTINWAMLACVALTLIAALPTFGNGIIAGADSLIHLHRIPAMHMLLSEGVWYPRWVSYFHLGYGYPIFNFYAPGAAYVGALFALLGFSEATAYTLTCALSGVIGSVGMYALARRFFPAAPALLASALWVFAPSRLFEFWATGSPAQMLSTALLPWLLWGMVKAAREASLRSIAAVALPLAGIIMTHQPTMLITALLVAPAALILPAWEVRRNPAQLLRRYAILGGGLALGAALSMIYVLPVVSELQYVRASQDAEDIIGTLRHSFLKPDELFALPMPLDQNDYHPNSAESLGLVGGVLSVLGALALLAKRRLLGAALLASLGFMLFMMIDLSLPVWLELPLFRQLRFPVRFLRAGAVFVALLGAASLLLLPRRWVNLGAGLAIGAVVLQAMSMIAPHQNFTPVPDLTAVDEIQMEAVQHNWGATSYGEFTPLFGERAPYDPPGDLERYWSHPFEIRVHRVEPADIQVNALGDAEYQVNAPSPATLTFRQFYFPGWSATLDGAPVSVRPEPEHGLMVVEVPSGEHIIRLAYTGTTAQDAGALISLLAAGVLVVCVAWRRGEKRALSGETIERGLARGVAVAAFGIALVNTYLLVPNPDWFRLHSPPDHPAYMQTTVYAAFGDAFELVGYTLNQTTVAPGDRLEVQLFWHPQREIDRNYRPVVQLVSPNLAEAWAVSEPLSLSPLLGATTVGMTPERFLSDEHRLFVKDEAPPYVGRIKVMLLDAETGAALRLPDGSDTLLLDPLVRVIGETEAVQLIDDYRLGDLVSLHCAFVAQNDEGVLVELYWSVTNRPPEELQVFVHALDSSGTLVTQADRPPLDGLYPVTAWLPGQTLPDRYLLVTDARVETVAVGLYRPTDQTRLPVFQNGNRLPNDQIILPMQMRDCHHEPD